MHSLLLNTEETVEAEQKEELRLISGNNLCFYVD